MKLETNRHAPLALLRVASSCLLLAFAALLPATSHAAQIAQGYTKGQWTGSQIGTGGDIQNVTEGSIFHTRTVPDFPDNVPWSTAIGFYIPNNAYFDGDTSKERVELHAASNSGSAPAWYFTDGEEVWIDFWNCVSTPHSTGSGWLFYDQLHLNQGGTQATLQHDYSSNERVRLSQGGTVEDGSIAGSPYSTTIVLNTWVRHTYHIKFSTTESGFLNYYRNGVLVNQRTSWISMGTVGGTAQVYPKIGVYRHASYSSAHVIYVGGYGIYDSNPLPPSAPAAPTGLTATAVSGTQVNLAWTDASSNETGFEIQRKANNGPYGTVHTTGAGVISWNDTGRSPGNYYTYQVRAIGAGGTSSAYSPEDNAGTPLVLDFNALTIASSSDTSTAVSFTGAGGGNFLRVDSNAVNDQITFNVSVANSLTYQVKVKHNRNDWRGIVQLAVNGTNLGATQNAHSETQDFAELTAGTTAIASGTRTFKFTVTGKSSGSQDYQMGLDLLTLTPTGL